MNKLMKKIFIWSSLFSISMAHSMLSITSFDRGRYIETFGEKKLTPQWSQEYIGSDLIQEELKDLNLSKINFAIFDLGFEQEYVTLTEPIKVPIQMNGIRKMKGNHGTSVASVVNGPYPYGNTEQIDLINLSAIYYPNSYTFAFRKFEKEERHPKVISNSLGWNDEQIKELVNEASKKNILWFLAAGNKWPEPVSDIEISSKALLIGSFAPNGLTSFESQLHKDMLVLAPANHELLAIDGDGNRTLFGSTSGATPIVAATVANIAALWPEIDRENIFKLIQMTAFPSAENKLGQKELPGILNAYKAFKVAQGILSYCRGTNKKKMGECFNESLNNPYFHYFDIDLISCDQFSETHPDFQLDILKKMRKRALLGVADQDRELACAYDYLGFTKNAEFFKFRAANKISMDDYLEEAKKAIKLGVFEISFYKYLKYMDQEAIKESINTSSEITDFRKEELLDFLK